MTEPAMTEQTAATTVAYDITANRKRLLQWMQQTHDTLRHVFAAIDQERATTLRDRRDGDKGWSALEVLCHLRDYDAIFRHRAESIRDQEYPSFARSDHEKLAQESHYNSQQLATVLEEFSQSRRQTLGFFESLDNQAWQRAGVHPERGHFTMLDAALQIGTHDSLHLEQITRILFQND